MRIVPKRVAGAPGLELLRGRGLRLTAPRRAILEVVRGTDAHPTAEWVYRRVRRRLPRVSLGTVYRNLRVLAEEGLVHALPGTTGRTGAASRGRFDGNTSLHHHFTCSDCGGIVDLHEPPDPSLDRRMAERTGLEISHHRIEFYGRCRACRARGRHRARAGKRR